MTDPDLKVKKVSLAGGFIVADGKISPDGKEWADVLPKNADDLKPWHPLMGFGWDAVRRAEAHHYSGIADVKAIPAKEE